MNHLVVISILLAVTHIFCFAAMSERKYPVRKTTWIYGAYAAFFIVWSLLGCALLNRNAMYMVATIFSGTIIAAFFVFIRMSSDAFCKKLFLFLSYSNIFCILYCVSALICKVLSPTLPSIGVVYARNIIRTLLYIPIVIIYLRFLRPYVRTVPGEQKRTWYSISLVSALFLIIYAVFVVVLLVPSAHTASYIPLFITLTLIYCAVLWVIFGTIRQISGESQRKLIAKNVEYLQRQLIMAKENAMTAKAMRHDFRHHMQYIDQLLKWEKTQEAVQYIEEFINSLDAAGQQEFCHHVTVNAILNSFYNKVRKEGISISVTADMPEHIVIADPDFVAILSNLLENAVNGCVECGSQGEINVNIHAKKEKLVIVCSNPCKPDLVLEDDIIKPKGTGIESILMAADRYDGNVWYRLEDGRVTACVVLNS